VHHVYDYSLHLCGAYVCHIISECHMQYMVWCDAMCVAAMSGSEGEEYEPKYKPARKPMRTRKGDDDDGTTPMSSYVMR
jgi:hypothetical protein